MHLRKSSLGKPEVIRKTLILMICCLSMLMIGMDVTIVNVALPAIQRDLHADLSGLQWVIDAFTLVVASLSMLAGAVSDRFGRRRVFQVGLLLFVFGSLFCSIAQTLGQLVFSRPLQGVGASMLQKREIIHKKDLVFWGSFTVLRLHYGRNRY